MKPVASEWICEGISFLIDDSCDNILELYVVIPYGDEYLAQMYYELEI